MKRLSMRLKTKTTIEVCINNAAVPIFVINAEHKVIIWNKACEELSGIKAAEVLGTDGHWKPFYDHERPVLADLVIDGDEDAMGVLYSVCSRSSLIPEGLQAEGWFRNLGGMDRYLCFTAAPICNDKGELVAVIETFQDTTEQKRSELELEQACSELKATQAQMLQNDKMASIGQLAAGVAHEINNPIAFVNSNLGTLEKYLAKMARFIDAQAEKIASHAPSEVVEGLNEQRRGLKLDYILNDAKDLIRESLDGTGRVQKIVQDLKTFSRVDAVEHTRVDINACLESTINIVWNEIKYKATLNRDFGDLPLAKCYPQQLNQVFMNLLINAAHAIDKEGTITVRSRHEDGLIHVAISDTGCGIPENIRTRIFEPFFTTKEVGKGTGLGLSISYDIVKKHDGEIKVESEVGKGTTFTVVVPVEAL